MYSHSNPKLFNYSKQSLVLASTVVIPISIYLVFLGLSQILSPELTFLVGSSIFWVFWGGLFGVAIVGKQDFLPLIRPRKPSLIVALLVGLIIIGAGSNAASIEINSPFMWFLWIIIGIGDGFVFEFLYRGVYYHQFEDNLFVQIIVSSIGMVLFGVAAYPFMLIKSAFPFFVASSFGFGVFQAIITRLSGNAWWAIFNHTFLAIFVLLL